MMKNKGMRREMRKKELPKEASMRGAKILSMVLTVIAVFLMFTAMCAPVSAKRPIIITTSETISGTINGQTFTGSGTGVAYLLEGREVGTVTFQDFPAGFHPFVFGKSWKCVCHKAVALELDGGMNLWTLARGNYDVETTMTFPNGDVIICVAQVRKVGDYAMNRCLSLNGTYTGPTDLVSMLPRVTIMRPAGPGKVIEEGTRQVVMSDGSIMQVKVYEEITFVNTTTELPFEQIMTYTPINASWTPENFTLQLEIKTTVKPAKEVPAITPLSFLLALLSLLGLGAIAMRKMKR